MTDTVTTNSDNFKLSRPLVVTLLGHVDHGKTTLLDSLCGTRLTDKEVGSMTQQVRTQSLPFSAGTITFVDTPGHAAFSKMRSRGGQVADIILLIVSAVDGVMAQTKEALEHALSAQVPIIVVTTKNDLPGADPSRVYQQLTQAGLLVESLGGEVVSVDISAKTKAGLDKLLEAIALVAEVEGIKEDNDSFSKGIVLESWLDSHQGVSCLVIVKSGKFSVGDAIYSFDDNSGKVRNLSQTGQGNIDQALPGESVILTGLSNVPEVGAMLVGEGGQPFILKIQELLAQQKQLATLEDFSSANIENKTLNLIIKADVLGSLEAIKESLQQPSDQEFPINIIHSATGDINESDVLLASSSGAVILGFRVKARDDVLYAATSNKVEIRTYDLIFNLLEDVSKALKGLLVKEREKIKGRAEIVKMFPLPSGDVVLGCKMLGGVLNTEDKVIVSRGEEGEIHRAVIKNIKQSKDQISRVSTGAECGLLLRPSFNAKKGDLIDRV